MSWSLAINLFERRSLDYYFKDNGPFISEILLASVYALYKAS